MCLYMYTNDKIFPPPACKISQIKNCLTIISQRNDIVINYGMDKISTLNKFSKKKKNVEY